jgi:hypothetical protein
MANDNGRLLWLNLNFFAELTKNMRGGGDETLSRFRSLVRVGGITSSLFL